VELQQLLVDVTLRPPADRELLDRLREASVALPEDYLAFMETSDGGEGDVGRAWLELWPASRVIAELASEPRYEGVALFAGDGANTVYGFDDFRNGAVVEGDWIGLARTELIPRGKTFTDFLRSLSDA